MQIKDGNWTLKEWRPDIGRTIWEYFDGAELHTKVEYDVSAVLEQNRRLRGDKFCSKNVKSKEGVGELVASIPEAIYWNQLAEADRQGDKAYIKRWLDDADNASFKV